MSTNLRCAWLDDLPECGTCQCPLTVKHILVECVDLKINTSLLLPLKIYLIAKKWQKHHSLLDSKSAIKLID